MRSKKPPIAKPAGQVYLLNYCSNMSYSSSVFDCFVDVVSLVAHFFCFPRDSICLIGDMI
jgi:hypothetical protein